MFFEERVDDLMRKMMRKKLYVVLSKPAVPPEKLKPFLMAHLEYMIGLEKRGLVFASGPLAVGERAGPDGVAGVERRGSPRARRRRPVFRQRLAQLRVEGMDGDGGHARPAR